MAQKPINMNQVKQVHQLWTDGIKIKEIVRRTGISRKTVKKYLRQLGMLTSQATAPQGLEITDKELADIVYNNDVAPIADKRLQALMAHFEKSASDLTKTGVTRKRLWAEYIEEHEHGYKYSQYCNILSKYLKDTDPTFHWEYRPAEFIQADFAGDKLSYVDKESGEVISAEVFIAILPFSGLIFCMAVATQRIADFAICINHMLKYFGGVPLTILVDNLKTAVKKADPFEPDFTRLCHQLSEHYNTTFSATRPRSPRDKGMVENAVKIVYRQIYAPMRHQTYYSLESLNHHIAHHLDLLNHKPYKNSQDSRLSIFESREKTLLKSLPETPFLLMLGKTVMVQRNYAIQLSDNKHYYTVPYQYVGKKVQVYYNARVVEVYYNHERISFHVRQSSEPQFNRIAEHMPPNHKVMVDRQGWTVESLVNQASKVGIYTAQIATRILHSSIYPEQNFKACNAMILLKNTYSGYRLEAACKHASVVKRPTLKLIRNILKTGQDKQALLFDEASEKPSKNHENIRGKLYYR
ncbi:IS21 family transposase [Niabella terrae]